MLLLVCFCVSDIRYCGNIFLKTPSWMHLTKTHTNGEVWDFAKIERKFIDEESSGVSQNVAKKEKRILCVMEKNQFESPIESGKSSHREFIFVGDTQRAVGYVVWKFVNEIVNQISTQRKLTCGQLIQVPSHRRLSWSSGKTVEDNSTIDCR